MAWFNKLDMIHKLDTILFVFLLPHLYRRLSDHDCIEFVHLWYCILIDALLNQRHLYRRLSDCDMMNGLFPHCGCTYWNNIFYIEFFTVLIGSEITRSVSTFSISDLWISLIGIVITLYCLSPNLSLLSCWDMSWMSGQSNTMRGFDVSAGRFSLLRCLCKTLPISDILDRNFPSSISWVDAYLLRCLR